MGNKKLINQITNMLMAAYISILRNFTMEDRQQPCPIGLFILLGVIQVIMIGLKLVSDINLSWLFVFTPTWLPPLALVIAIIIHWRTS